MGFKRDPFSYFDGAAADRAVHRLSEYYRTYNGRAFDQLAARSDPEAFTAWDVVAVEMLSVKVPQQAAISLIDDVIGELPQGRLSQLLASVPSGASITDETDHLSLAPALELWSALRRLKGVGRTTASKLLAAKRPALFPIYDSRIASALLEDPNEDQWPLWRELFTGARGEEFVRLLRDCREKADLLPCVSELRVFDVVVWMDETEHR